MDAVIEDVKAEESVAENAPANVTPLEKQKEDEPVLMGRLLTSHVPLKDYFGHIVDLLHFDIRQFKDLQYARRGLVFTDRVSGHSFSLFARITAEGATNSNTICTPHFTICDMTITRLPAVFAIYRHPLEGQVNSMNQPTPWKVGIANFGDADARVRPVTEVELQKKFIKWMMDNLGHNHPDFMNAFIVMAANSRKDVAAGHNWKTKAELQALMHPTVHPA